MYTFIKIILLSISALAIYLASHSIYLYAKAHLAQYLLETAWKETLESKQQHQPWQWSDSYPVAQLTLFETKGEKEIKASWVVLAGMHGRNMAFAPSWKQDSAPPNQFGNTVISAHNDSHFSVLNEVNVGDKLSLVSTDGIELDYQVDTVEIVQDSDNSGYKISHDTRITLITCYPFSSTSIKKSHRYVVQAVAL